MTTFNMRITQVFKTCRVIYVEVDADSTHDALEKIDSGSIDAPAFVDPRWHETHELQNEESELEL